MHLLKITAMSLIEYYDTLLQFGVLFNLENPISFYFKKYNIIKLQLIF